MQIFRDDFQHQHFSAFFRWIRGAHLFFINGPVTSKQVVVISVTQKVTLAKWNSLTRAQFWLYVLKTQRRVW